MLSKLPVRKQKNAGTPLRPLSIKSLESHGIVEQLLNTASKIAETINDRKLQWSFLYTSTPTVSISLPTEISTVNSVNSL